MTGSPSRLAGLILAGGAGTRYGEPKAWATLPDGRTFLEACADCLVGGGAAPIVATTPPCSEDPKRRGLRVLTLPQEGLDMFASIRLGLGALVEDTRWSRVAVLAVDHPLIRPETVAALAAASGPATVPVHRGRRGHPVVLNRSLAEEISNGRRPGPTLRDVLRSSGFREVEVDDGGVTVNCNTPQALAEALVTTGELG